MSTLVEKSSKFSATAVIDGKSIVRNYGIDQFIGKKMFCYFFTPKIFLEYVLEYMTFKKNRQFKSKMLK